MHLDDLPDDILVIIFDILVSGRFQYRKHLLLTSKRWQSVAKSYSPLWTNVAWRWEGDKHSNRILCSDLRSFSQIVRMAGKAPLDLYFSATSSKDCTDDIITEFIASVPMNWTSSCQSLRLSSSVPREDISGMNQVAKLFGSAGFKQLRTLELYEQSRNEMGPSLARLIMELVNATSLDLRSLQTNYPSEVFNYSATLRRLKELHIDDDFAGMPMPWQHFSNLEKLTFLNLANPNEEALLNIKPFNLLELSMGRQQFVPTSRFLDLLGARLTHLMVTSFNTQIEDDLSLPNLRYLSVFSSRCIRYDMITAPKLSELIIWYPYNSTREDYLEMATFHPKRVALNINRSSIEVYESFFKVMKLWTRVDELHLRLDTSHRAQICSNTIVNSIKDQPGRLNHSELRLLSILYEESPIKVQFRREEEITKLFLSETVTAPPHIERLKVGWYSGILCEGWRGQWIEESMEDRHIFWKWRV